MNSKNFSQINFNLVHFIFLSSVSFSVFCNLWFSWINHYIFNQNLTFGQVVLFFSFFFFSFFFSLFFYPQLLETLYFVFSRVEKTRFVQYWFRIKEHDFSVYASVFILFFLLQNFLDSSKCELNHPFLYFCAIYFSFLRNLIFTPFVLIFFFRDNKRSKLLWEKKEVHTYFQSRSVGFGKFPVPPELPKGFGTYLSGLSALFGGGAFVLVHGTEKKKRFTLI